MKRASAMARGQAAVETALVLPLFVFIMLGTLQLALMHQARLMTKYSAYKAARAGSLNSAGWEQMNRAAMAVLVPMISSGDAGKERVFRADTAAHWKESWQALAGNAQPGGEWVPYVTVKTCNPTIGNLRGIPHVELHKGVDFDDPLVLGSGGWYDGNRTRLHVQATLFYRLQIPFVNGLLWWLAHGDQDQQSMRVLRMSRETLHVDITNGQERGSIRWSAIEDRANQHEYLVPIRASWGMRMQSKLWPEVEGYELPETSTCRVPWGKK